MTVTDADARQTTQVANALGQVIEVSDAEGNTSTFQYNALGQRTSVTHGVGTAAENSVDYAWDRLGRQLSDDDPDRGLYSFTYDALGQMTNLTNPVLAAASQSQTMSYDLLGRLTSRAEPEGTATWTYDTGTGLTVGRLVSESVGGFSRSVAYGPTGYGKPTAITTTIDGQSYTLSQSYDAAGRLETLTYPASQAYPSGLTVGYFYNVRGYLEQVTGPGNALYYQVAEQDARGRLRQDWLGDDSLNDYTYAANSSRLTGQSSAIGTTPLQEFAYTYDAVGNIASRSDVQQSLSESFTYDGLDRLTAAQVGTNAPTGMSYDLLGNLLSKSDLGSYAYGENGAGLHALTTLTTTTNQTVTYTYDANGNMTGGGGRTLGWTTYNQLSQVSKAGITYTFQSGTDRQRYKKVRTSGTTQTTHYVGDVFEKITESGLTTYRHYVKVNGKAVAIVVDQNLGADVTKYLHRDHLGSLTTITDSAGAVLERLSYDSYGKRRSATTWQAGSITAAEIRGYTGHEHLDDVGLIHMNGRVYDPSLGRMLSPDPVTQSPENAQNYKRYAYVMNSPMRFVDPSGYQAAPACPALTVECTVYNSIAYAVGDFLGGLFGGGGNHCGPSCQGARWRAAEARRIEACNGDTICIHFPSFLSWGGPNDVSFSSDNFSDFIESEVQAAVTAALSELNGDKPNQGDVVGGGRQPGIIYVTGHRVNGAGPYHLAIEYRSAGGGVVRWISAGPEGYPDNETLADGVGTLFNGVRPTDAPSVNETIGIANPPAGMSNDEYFAVLINASNNYDGQLDYDLFPEVGDSYNSNSYVSGIISATGGSTNVDLCGYVGGCKPVPSEYFNPK